MGEFPILRGAPECPAGCRVQGVDAVSQGVVCCAMQQDIERDDGTDLSMSAGKYGYLQHEATGGVYLTLKSDPSTVLNLCYGRGLPVLSDADRQARDHYTYCPVWQAEKDRLAAGEDRLARDEPPEPVSMGMDAPTHTLEAADPWAQARADLDVLASAGA